jgi:alkylated DNA repair dioxygenase AlkB
MIRFIKAKSSSGPTRFLHVSGAGSSLGTTEENVRAVFDCYGSVDVEFISERRYCFVIYKDIESAIRATETFQSKVFLQLSTSQLQIRYAEIDTSPLKSPEPECVSMTNYISVPGCFIIPEFISEDEEIKLMQLIEEDKSAPWESNLTRRVKHYGFPFNYRTLMLDYAANTPKMPPPCDELAREMLGLSLVDAANIDSDVETQREFRAQHRVSESILTQLTVNEYLPGQGIAQHIDTETCFGPDIYILNMGCAITMTLQVLFVGLFCYICIFYYLYADSLIYAFG